MPQFMIYISTQYIITDQSLLCFMQFHSLLILLVLPHGIMKQLKKSETVEQMWWVPYLLAIVMLQMPEEEAFAVLVKLMQDYKMRDMYKPTMAELGLCMYQLENLVQVRPKYRTIFAIVLIQDHLTHKL